MPKSFLIKNCSPKEREEQIATHYLGLQILPSSGEKDISGFHPITTPKKMDLPYGYNHHLGGMQHFPAAPDFSWLAAPTFLSPYHPDVGPSAFSVHHNQFSWEEPWRRRNPVRWFGEERGFSREHEKSEIRWRRLASDHGRNGHEQWVTQGASSGRHNLATFLPAMQLVSNLTNDGRYAASGEIPCVQAHSAHDPIEMNAYSGRKRQSTMHPTEDRKVPEMYRKVPEEDRKVPEKYRKVPEKYRKVPEKNREVTEEEQAIDDCGYGESQGHNDKCSSEESRFGQGIRSTSRIGVGQKMSPTLSYGEEVGKVPANCDAKASTGGQSPPLDVRQDKGNSAEGLETDGAKHEAGSSVAVEEMAGKYVGKKFGLDKWLIVNHDESSSTVVQGETPSSPAVEEMASEYFKKNVAFGLGKWPLVNQSSSTTEQEFGEGQGGENVKSLLPGAFQGVATRTEQKPTKAKPRHRCDECGHTFTRSSTLTTHKRIHTGEKPYSCEQCGRAFRQLGNLSRHRLTHTTSKPYVCPHCNKAFNRASNLHTHMRTHSDYKPFSCDFCSKRFHQKIDMRIHRYTHTGEKPHKCGKCGRGFKQLTHLTYHLRTHSQERLYKCDVCGKGFNQKGNLKAHSYQHTGERPFKCEVCSKGFTLASTLNTHRRIHADKKPFQCEFCSKAFYQKNALKTHYVASHPYTGGVLIL